ncbi:MAG: DUF4465 domain-containing protein [Planctomycetales bacterium]|nr:DUF4465 domain-containing protein [Planctomycetales bacterium]
MNMHLSRFVVALLCLGAAAANAQTIIDLEALPFGAQPYFNGNPALLGGPAVPTPPSGNVVSVDGSFTSGGATFGNLFTIDNTFGFPFDTWSGFSYSKATDAATPGFSNQYSASPGAGFGGSSVYAVGFTGNGPPSIELPAGFSPSSLEVANTTYAFLAMRDGNDGAGFVRQFGDLSSANGNTGNEGAPDYLLLTITGRDSLGSVTGTIDYYLADYRFADNADDYVVDDWDFVDLTSLGAATRMLEFDLETTDLGPFGANTPLFFAIDNLTLSSNASGGPVVPEPASLTAMLICAAVLLMAFRKRARGIGACATGVSPVLNRG